MNRQLVIGLALAILFMAGLAAVVLSTSDAETPAPTGAALPGLKGVLAESSQVTLASTEHSVTLRKMDAGWQVEEKSGYPADFERIKTLLNGLADAERLEMKTARPENHARLGLAGLEAGDTGSTMVSITAGDTRFVILLGETATGRDGVFARNPEEDQTWLISAVGDVSADPVDWIDPVVINVESGRVASAVLASGDNVLEVQRSETSENMEVLDLPQGASLQYDTVANSIARALVNVRMSDVRPRTELPFDAASASFSLDNGQTVRVTMTSEADGRWARFEVDGADDAAQPVDGAGLLAWEYQLPDYVYGNLTRTMEDMIEVPEPDATVQAP